MHCWPCAFSAFAHNNNTVIVVFNFICKIVLYAKLIYVGSAVSQREHFGILHALEQWALERALQVLLYSALKFCAHSCAFTLEQ